MMTAREFQAAQVSDAVERYLAEVTWTTIGEPLNAMVTLDNTWMIRQTPERKWNVYRRTPALVWERVAVRETLLTAVRFATEGHRGSNREGIKNNADGIGRGDRPAG